MIEFGRYAKLVSLSLLASFAAACAVTPEECDPRTGDPSLYVKAHCYYSDEYTRREEHKRTVLEEELRLKALFEETYAALKAEQIRLESNTVESTSELSAISRSVATLHDALQSRARDDIGLEKQIAELRVEAEKIEQQPGQSPVQQRQALSDLMVKVSDLQKTMDLR